MNTEEPPIMTPSVIAVAEVVETPEDSADNLAPQADQPTLPPVPTQKKEKVWLEWGILALILILAAFLRWTGLNWDDRTHLHPDERFLTIVASKLQLPSNPLDYLRTSVSTLNPYNAGEGFYVYGNLPMTLTRLAAESADALCQTRADGCQLFGQSVSFIGYDGIHYVGRFLSGLLDIITVLTIYAIGKKLYNRWIGLLAALLHACAVMAIQQSHFFTADNWSSTFCLLALYTAILASKELRLRWYLLFGIFAGCALASRINVVPLVPMLGVAGVIWLSNQLPLNQALTTQRGWDLTMRMVGYGSIAALVTLITFRIAMPYAFSDAQMARETVRQSAEQRLCETTGCRTVQLDEINPNSPAILLRSIIGFNPLWLKNMGEIQNLQKPDAVFPPALQWTNRLPIFFPLTNMVLWGMGITAGIAAWVGAIWALKRLLTGQDDWKIHTLPLLWSLGYFFFMATRWVKSVRYFLPIYPTLFLFAAWLLWLIWQRAPQRYKPLTLAVSLSLLLIPSLWWAFSFVSIYRPNNFTRIQATEWFYENIPSGATLLYQEDGAPKELILPFKGGLLQLGSSLYIPIPASQEGKITITGLRFNYVSDDDFSADSNVVRLYLNQSGQPLTSTEAPINPTNRRQPIEIALSTPQTVAANTQLDFTVELLTGGLLNFDTTIIANEHWDDSLPTRTDRDPFGQYYNGLRDDNPETQFDGQMPVTWPDSELKRQGYYRWLDGSDVIALSSQRSLWHTVRLPTTYPLNIRFYEALFDEALGFELVAHFSADFRFGPLHISDVGGNAAWRQRPNIGWPPPSDWTAAEEAFSVYDHPPVWIFRKRADYDSVRMREVLSAVDLSQTMFMNPGQATEMPTGLFLSAEQSAEQQRGGTFQELFPATNILNQRPMLAAISWYLTAATIGLLILPILYTIFPALPSRGYAFGRMLGLLLIAYLGWSTSSVGLSNNSANTYYIALLIVGLLSLGLASYQKNNLITYLRQQSKTILLTELIALVLFLFALGVRLGNPDVWDVIWGGEKPMDLTYFTAVLKSSTFPPYDPWYAGGMLNYYYYGFVIVGTLTKMLGITPTIAYNIAIPFLFTCTGIGAFALAHDLTTLVNRHQQKKHDPLWETVPPPPRHASPLIAGLFAVALCVILGNLGQFATIAKAWGTAGRPVGIRNAPIYTGDWFWNASRAISVPEGEVGPITEFPYFTFLYGDLHAHMIALPLTLVALAWLISYSLREKQGGFTTLLTFICGAVIIGALYPTNSWDFPTYLLLSGLAFFLYHWRTEGFTVLSIGRMISQLLLFAIAAYLFYAPFHKNFAAGYSEIALWQGVKTGLPSYLTVYGLFLLITIVHLIRETRAWLSSLQVSLLEKIEPYQNKLTIALVLFLLLIFVAIWWGLLIAPIVLPIIVISTLLALPDVLPAPRRIILAFIAAAYGLTLMVDVIVIEGTIGRMNTVFKFYMQVWVILSVVCGYAFAQIQANTAQWGRRRASLWWTTWGVLTFIALLYPLTATPAKWYIRMNPDAPRTLDGMAFMPYVSYGDTDYLNNSQDVSLSADYTALRWMQANISGSPVVAEAYSDNYYRSIGNRVAMYTGLPTIIGWGGHQMQQRNAVPDSRINQRTSDVERLYNTLDWWEAQAILDRYGVELIYIGRLETIYYTPEGLQKFRDMATNGLLQQLYEAEGVTLYRVLREES